MGRSQASFGKKENEKKRLKRRKEKEEKREARQANSSKGKGFDDMIAYVDAYGRITSTPPDPTEKEEIAAEDIELGVSRQPDDGDTDRRSRGRVSHYNTEKGYGFIKVADSNDSIFFHMSDLKDEVKESSDVIFDVEKGPKGLMAKNVEKVNS